jgi:hypothetical protein
VGGQQTAPWHYAQCSSVNRYLLHTLDMDMPCLQLCMLQSNRCSASGMQCLNAPCHQEHGVCCGWLRHGSSHVSIAEASHIASTLIMVT